MAEKKVIDMGRRKIRIEDQDDKESVSITLYNKEKNTGTYSLVVADRTDGEVLWEAMGAFEDKKDGIHVPIKVDCDDLLTSNFQWVFQVVDTDKSGSYKVRYEVSQLDAKVLNGEFETSGPCEAGNSILRGRIKFKALA